MPCKDNTDWKISQSSPLECKKLLSYATLDAKRYQGKCAVIQNWIYVETKGAVADRGYSKRKLTLVDLNYIKCTPVNWCNMMLIEGAERDEIDLKSNGGGCLKRPKNLGIIANMKKAQRGSRDTNQIIPTSVHWGLIYAVTQTLGS